MSVKRNIPESAGIFFITFTCTRWLPLFEITNAYDTVYKWFDYLKSKYHFILGYTIMPNHLHVIISCPENDKGINKIVSNGKRFIAYDMVERLKQLRNTALLIELAQAVSPSDKKRGKLHQVFEPSFDCKECHTASFIKQKLDYIHLNPKRGKWNLCDNPSDYTHSSAKCYLAGQQGIYQVLNYRELDDIEWAKSS